MSSEIENQIDAIKAELNTFYGSVQMQLRLIMTDLDRLKTTVITTTVIPASTTPEIVENKQTD